MINTGAFINGDRPQTKKALREAVTAGQDVEFDPTSLFPQGEELVFTPAYLVSTRPEVQLSVVGPDPYTSRKWYATVEVKNGQVRVS